jgi:hypothetical protein
MNVENLSGRLAALIAAVVVLVVLLLGWFVLLAPQRAKVTSLDSQISQTQAEIAATQAYVASPATKKAVAQLARLKAMVPDDERMSSIMRQLAAAAAASGVRIDGITPSPPTAVGSAQAVPIQLAVEGHYGGLTSFLQILRAQAGVKGDQVTGTGRLYSVSGIQFTRGATASGAGNNDITATVALNAFMNGVSAAPGTTPTTTTTAP